MLFSGSDLTLACSNKEINNYYLTINKTLLEWFVTNGGKFSRAYITRTYIFIKTGKALSRLDTVGSAKWSGIGGVFIVV